MSEYVFKECRSLTDVDLPDGIEDIYSEAFSGCTALTHITLPRSVFHIDRDVFEGCTALTDIYVDQDKNYECCLFDKVDIPDGCTIHWV